MITTPLELNAIEKAMAPPPPVQAKPSEEAALPP